MAIGGYFINDYWWLLMVTILVVFILMVIDGYFIGGY
jgi:hypothetical protein